MISLAFVSYPLQRLVSFPIALAIAAASPFTTKVVHPKI